MIQFSKLKCQEIHWLKSNSISTLKKYRHLAVSSFLFHSKCLKELRLLCHFTSYEFEYGLCIWRKYKENVRQQRDLYECKINVRKDSFRSFVHRVPFNLKSCSLQTTVLVLPAIQPTVHPVLIPKNQFCVMSLDPDTLPSIATTLIDVLFYSSRWDASSVPV